jgi:hypothetical protein
MYSARAKDTGRRLVCKRIVTLASGAVSVFANTDPIPPARKEEVELEDVDMNGKRHGREYGLKLFQTSFKSVLV